MPIVPTEVERKLFLVCELNVGNDVVANVMYAGNTSGLPNEPILKDTFLFFIAEGQKDKSYKLSYNPRDKNYGISKGDINLIPGESYKFRGVSLNANNSEPTIVIPSTVLIDGEMSAIKIDRKLVDGRYVTTIKCNVNIDNSVNEASYFYIEPILPLTSNFVCKFEKDFQAYKPLKHKKGFLVDYQRIKDRNLEFYLELNEELPSTLLDIQIANVTQSYYKYNYYYSNASENVGQTLDNQAIANFNVFTEKAFGTFSAINSRNYNISIK